MILGIDEVGRGCWAGPLVVGAVVLGDTKIDGLTDSKALSKKRREKLDAEIRASGAGVGLGWVSAEEIDKIGLSEALRLATKRAVKEVQASGAAFHEIIIDGTVNFLSDTPLSGYVSVLKKADLLISSVSAASIVAKVARDAYMTEQALEYPELGFEQHVGYGTAAHRRAIDENGVTPLHRLSIAPLAKYRHISSPTEAAQKQARGRRIFSKITSRRPAELLVNGRVKQSSSGREVIFEKNGSAHNVSSQPQPTTRAIGDVSETAAAEYLQADGYEILDRNWKTKICEIDIVARRDDVYYFAEVKHRKNDKSGDGLAAITPKKLNQMKKSAELYALMHKLTDVDLRLMAISTRGESMLIDQIVDVS